MEEIVRVVGLSHAYGNAPSAFVKYEEFIDELRN